MLFSNFYQLVKKSVLAWIEDYAPSMGAAISYYTVFSIAPLLIIVIAVAGFVWGREAVQGEIVEQLSGMIGQEGAKGVQTLIESANQPTKGLVATVISIVVLVVGATTVFAELQSALDRIWRVPQEAKANGIWATLRNRILSLGFILGLGFLLLVSLVSSAGIAAMGSWASEILPGWELMLHAINIVLSLIISTVLFAMIYKVMPQARVSWRDVWVGASVTAVLFEIGKTLISLYIGKSSVTSSFAAAGSLVVLLIWVYYSAQIFLLGAEFTWVYANDMGSLAKNGNDSVKSTDSINSIDNNNAAISSNEARVIENSDKHNSKPPDSLPLQIRDDLPLDSPAPQALKSADSPGAVLSSKGARHASVKQRAIVYAGSAAAYLALRLLLKKNSRKRMISMGR
jgi:membrane protein